LEKDKIITNSEYIKIALGHDVKKDDDYEPNWKYILQDDDDDSDEKIEEIKECYFDKNDFKEYLFDI
jgi:hypothetical protein